MYSLAFTKQSVTPPDPTPVDDSTLVVTCVCEGAAYGPELSGPYELYNDGKTGTQRSWYLGHSTYSICTDGEKWCLGDLGGSVYPLFVSEPVNGVQPDNPADATWIPVSGAFAPGATMTIVVQ